MTRFLVATFLGFALLFSTACGSGSSSSTTTTTTPTSPQIAGSWEIAMQSLEKPGYSTLIETNLQETGGGSSSSGTLSASGASQLILVGQHPSGGLYFGGNCSPIGTNSLTGTVSTADAVSLVLTENTTVYTFTGTLTGSNNTMSGTYVLTSGTCQDSGNFVGQQVGQISGTYTGTLTLTNASGSDNASAVLTESPGGFTEALTLSGAHHETDTLSGIVVGDVFSVTGKVASTTVHYYGYYAPGQKAVFMVDAAGDALLGTLRAP